MHKPSHIKGAIDLMTALADACYVAGGTKVMPLIAKGKLSVTHLISLEGLPDLTHVQKLNGYRLGSGLRYTNVRENDVIRQQYTALYDATHILRSARGSSRSTLGGICAVRFLVRPLSVHFWFWTLRFQLQECIRPPTPGV
jgi:CO/xanthine dehydrogenase FAD-binding subunit